ncbi:MAG TPA: lysine 2,3-aminomutase [Planctomycetaceae bacterium]|nr:lysine 2,3-aminomutase [Planctomycetaceae bacterium]
MGISRAPSAELITDLIRPVALDESRTTSVLRIAEFAETDLLPPAVAPPALPVIPYCVSPFYAEHLRNSPHYEQLRHIVEPSPDELTSPGQWDTSGEHSNTKLTGLQHKYPQTALLLVTDNCFSYCRFCFRKRFVGRVADEIASDYPAIGRYIAAHPEITNVLISGGDPFVLSTEQLGGILDHILPIPHLRSIRFGTKSIVHNPARFADTALTAMFQRIRQAGKAPLIISHVDHFGEISPDTEDLVRHLLSVGVQFLNQTVLLNRINDTAETLTETFRKLHCMGLRPYYLFQARPVCQGSHFQVPFHRAIEIVQGAQRRLGGIEKTFRYIMSHRTGKIEILDLGDDGRLYMRYHQCPNTEKIGRIFSRRYREGACWLDELYEDD